MCFQAMAFLLCHVLVNTSHFPTILPTNAPNLRKTSRYILKHINTRRSPNPLQHRGLGDLTWHEWVHRKRIHGFLVRMRSAVRIRPAAPTKTPETPVFREFFHARKQALALFLVVCGASCPLKPLKKEGDGSFRPPPAVLVLFYADNSSVRVV